MIANCQPRARRAFTMIEVVVTALILVIAMSLTMKLLAWVAHERREAERRLCAIAEVANTMERFAARPLDEVTEQSARSLKISETTREALPDAELKVNVDDKAAGDDSKRIVVQLRWRNRAGEWNAPVRLTSWISKRRTRS